MRVQSTTRSGFSNVCVLVMMSPPLHYPAQKKVRKDRKTSVRLTLVVQTKWERKMKATKISCEIFGALFALPTCGDAVCLWHKATRCERLKRKRKRRFPRWHMHGSRKLDSWCRSPLAVQKIRAKKETLLVLSAAPRAVSSLCKKFGSALHHPSLTFCILHCFLCFASHECTVSSYFANEAVISQPASSLLQPPLPPLLFHLFE